MMRDAFRRRDLAPMINDLLTFFGLTAGSRWNLFWGGIGSCLSEFAILGIVWHKLNCHARGRTSPVASTIPSTPAADRRRRNR